MPRVFLGLFLKREVKFPTHKKNNFLFSNISLHFSVRILFTKDNILGSKVLQPFVKLRDDGQKPSFTKN